MLIRWLILVLLLTAQAWCRTPEAVVREIYQTHLETQNLKKTLARVPHCFTPGFLGVMERALSPRHKGVYVDMDFLANAQTDFGHFEVGQASGDFVPVKVWAGLRSRETLKDPAKRASWPYVTAARFYFTDVGNGPQVRDIEWVARSEKYQGKMTPRRPALSTPVSNPTRPAAS